MALLLSLALLIGQQKAVIASTSLSIIRPNVEFGGWAGWDTKPPSGAISEDGRWSAYSWMGALELQEHTGSPHGWTRKVTLRGRGGRPLDLDREGKWSVQTVPLALTPDGRLLARGTSFGFVIEDVKTGEVMRARQDRDVENPARGLMFSPDGKTLALVSGSQGKFHLSFLDLATGRENKAASPVAARAWTPRFTRDSKYVVAASPQPMLIERGGRVRLEMPGEARAVYFTRMDGTRKALGLAALRGMRWRTRWTNPNEAPSDAIQYAELERLRSEVGIVDPSGAWYAAPLKTPGAYGYKAGVRVLRPKGALDVELGREADGLGASPGGRWLLILDSTRFLVVDTRM